MSKLIENWKTAKRAREDAEQWESLPCGRAYNGSKFAISVAHSVPPRLVRAGQQVCGGPNYWETQKEFNAAILDWIVDNWDVVYSGSIEIMKQKEKAALIACQEHISAMQALIDEVSNESH